MCVKKLIERILQILGKHLWDRACLLDKTGHLCEIPSNLAKGNGLPNKAYEEMVSCVLLKLLKLYFLSHFTFASENRNAQKITLRTVQSVYHVRHI